jgi:hypothetical protein
VVAGFASRARLVFPEMPFSFGDTATAFTPIVLGITESATLSTPAMHPQLVNIPDSVALPAFAADPIMSK